MAHHFASEIPPHLLMWQRVREYAVPPSMIENATARRAVGDWAGACAAARCYVDLDLRAVRDRHGTETVTRLRADLRRLAPDLLRWHMPRIAPDGRLRPGLTLSLARYAGSGGTPLHLVVRTPPARADGGQYMSLALWEGSGDGDARHHPHPHPDRRFRLDLHRHLWDAGRSGELGARCGAGGALSLAVSDQVRVADRVHVADQVRVGDRGHAADRAVLPGARDARDTREQFTGSDSSWAVGSWAAEAESLLRAEGLPRGAFTVRLGARRRAVLDLVAPDDSHAPTLRPLREGMLPSQVVAALPVLPEAAARVLPDLELLRAGLVSAGRLHPLVGAALAAFVPSSGASTSAPAESTMAPPGGDLAPTGGDLAPAGGPVAPAGGPVAPAGAPDIGSAAGFVAHSADPVLLSTDPHRVECRGETHRIALRNGVLTAVDHDPGQLRREELLVALGGPALPCLRAIDAVHRDPEALPAVRERLRHGDVVGALGVVEGLLGPAAVLRDGPLRSELESATARRIDHGLFRSGLVGEHPGARASDGGHISAPARSTSDHRPRLERRTPLPVRRKLGSRSRPRTSQSS